MFCYSLKVADVKVFIDLGLDAEVEPLVHPTADSDRRELANKSDLIWSDLMIRVTVCDNVDVYQV